MEADDEKAEREEVEAAPDDPGLKADDDDEHVDASQLLLDSVSDATAAAAAAAARVRVSDRGEHDSPPAPSYPPLSSTASSSSSPPTLLSYLLFFSPRISSSPRACFLCCGERW